ncbi:InlB B-repeat-containing protein [Cohnella cholangitidis]|uniref:SLH domain-containing protein n=1 Tax=Cohnella cholangitidis TaxID=2598458 RepID=A0A7G5C2W7_9BACL|nr:InlB B-repeat-containing protein [Cohnella cholangitidis]QMV43551.1 hypothetical protein FPL14_21990 [Cohnella cholangitidis]
MGPSGDTTLYAQWTVNDYPVSYDGNGATSGSAPSGGSYAYGSDIAVQGNTGNLVKTGHTFTGWNTAANGSGTAYAPAATLNIGPSGVILYAQWTINSYEVAYNGNGNTGGNAPVRSSHPYGSGVTVSGNSGNLVKTGHTFAGWNTAVNGSGLNYAPGSTFNMGAAGMTLYAQWTVNSYAVNFQTNGGSSVGYQMVEFGQKVTMPSEPTKTGYTFAGWYTDGGLLTPFSFETPMGAATMTLYAKWTTNSYPVSYNGNGQTGGTVPPAGSHAYNTSVTVQGNAGGLFKTGYTFAGWNTAADGSGTPYVEAQTFTIGAGGVVLYAIWTVNSYTVSYDSNASDGGSAPSGMSGNYNTSITLPGNVGNLEKIGHTFAGWNTAADGTGTNYAAGASYSIGASDEILYAAWSVNSYTVSYDGNGSSGGSSPADASHNYNTGVTVAGSGSLFKTGYTFAGWNTAADGTGTGYVEHDAFTIGAANVSLYAVWTINSYTVSFDADGGTPVSDQTVIYGNTVSKPVDPEKTGHTFDGWYTDEDLLTPYDFAAAIGDSDFTLYAKWNINSYTVAYDGNGSTEGTAPTSVSYDYNVNVAVSDIGNLVKAGHTFAGWNTAADGSGTGYDAGDTLTIGTAGVTLFAQWTVNSYSVAYDGSGATSGNVPAGSSYDYNANVTVPNNSGNLEKTGYTFAGWNTAVDGSGTVYRPGETFAMGAGPVTLFAQWLSNNALLSFLTVDASVLSPTFSPTVLNYEVELDYLETELNLSFSQADPTQFVSVTGAVYQSVTGAVYHYQATGLPIGPTPIRFGVTAQDGTVNAYTIIVKRDSGNNADLSGLSLSGGSLSPVFAPGTTTYSANVSNGVSSLAVTAIASESLASITVNGQPVISGQPSAAIQLAVGSSPISVEVTARDGTKKTYAVDVYRASASGGGTGPIAPAPGSTTSENGQIVLPPGEKGEVSLGNAITVSIPAGASGQELKVSIAERLDAPVPTGSSPISPILWITSNSTALFLKPVTVALTFDSAKLKGNQEAVVFAYDEESAKWTKVEGGRVNGNRIEVDVKRLLPMVVMAVDKVTEPSPGTKPDRTFGDVSGHWAAATIEQAIAAGIVSGYPNGTFKPNQTVTRAEFAVLLVKALHPQGEAATLEFEDKRKIGTWARNAVAQAVQAGWIKGYKDGSFRPDAEITRAEMAAMVANAMGKSFDADATTLFADDKDIPKWAKSAANAVQQSGLIQGKGSGEFDPFGKTTRAEAVTVLLKLLDSQR